MGGLAGAAKLIDHVLQLFTDEHGNDSGRCLVSAESVIISDICRRFTKQIGMTVNGL